MDETFQTIYKRFEKGDIIFNEGNASDGLYFIKQGKVKIFKRVYCNGKTVEYELARLGQNAIFGEMALLGERQRTASVRAIHHTTCMIITRNVFEHHISRLPDWVQTVIKNLVVRLDDTNKKIKDLLEK
ncbi:MAG: Crp/Fnr family transcriptional regulator [Fibrobacterota bacterium]|jgi:CRP-like cAMP-binding protein